MTTRTEELAARWAAVMMSNYKTPPVALARGEGATVWDVDSREYTDLRTRRSSRRSPPRRTSSATSPTWRCTSQD
jgi:4-aminobutyrate aminotransferase-like enzyme